MWALVWGTMWAAYGLRLGELWLWAGGLGLVGCWVVRAWRPLACLVALNPLVLTVGLTAWVYAFGSPGLNGAAAFGGRGADLDRTLRVPRWAAEGSTTRTPRGVRPAVWNLTLRGLVAAFGPPASAYRGAYPTQAQAEAALDQRGGPIDLLELAAGRIVDAGLNQTIDVTQARAIARGCLPLDAWPDVNQHARRRGGRWVVEAVVIEPDCLVLRMPAERISADPQLSGDRVLLLDLTRGQVFASYVDDPNARVLFIRQWGR